MKDEKVAAFINQKQVDLTDLENIFKDLKVVELASVLAGPMVGSFFSELGATVIKIENSITNGDVTRNWKHSKEIKEKKDSFYYFSANFNKEVMMLDLSLSDQFLVASAIIAEADIVLSNMKPISAVKLGLDYHSIKEIKPDVIFAQITAYGENDVRSGFDILIQAETGWISMMGEEGGNEVRIPVALMDILTAHQLKEGILVALIKKYKTGLGSKVSVSLFDTGIASLANQAANWLNLKILPQRMGTLHPNIAPYGEIVYTKDDIPILLAIGTEKHFVNLCKLLEIDIYNLNIFSSNAVRVQNRMKLYNYLNLAASQFLHDDVIRKARSLQVPLSTLNNMEEVFNTSRAKDLILEQKDDLGNVVSSVRTTIFKIE